MFENIRGIELMISLKDKVAIVTGASMGNNQNRLEKSYGSVTGHAQKECISVPGGPDNLRLVLY